MATLTALNHRNASQQALLRYLLRHPAGAAVDELVAHLEVSTTAVRQHLVVLERDGVVQKGSLQSTGRRPKQLFILTTAGRELFPRHYRMLAEQLIATTRSKLGSKALQSVLRELGRDDGRASRIDPSISDHAELSRKLASLLTLAGYEATVQMTASGPQVTAFNCVFHHLAAQFAEVCEYDLAFIESATGREVTHTACMLRGGTSCRFLLQDVEALTHLQRSSSQRVFGNGNQIPIQTRSKS